ncbi:GNAT family N-acetyltransferase [Chelatococcus asaccharovorans]|uniref:GNAT family N-acetyltransferase n=1 Tax=Chelatococcus asaccharovorans TaxID=28210 RepID=UPI00224C7A88|nr:GNAT family N-acetyltransferase [Chelatococcus asaccharovorans]CAH1671949.1 GNAT family acetyltransferase [Chelatococcus asaccharovorans]CAH1676626.1 GNAT family acetyltransferase [Chelatococcus asaccharovorans]
MGKTIPAPALRPFLPSDLAVVAAIFQDSIEELTEDDYSEAQRAAWAERADGQDFAARLTAALTLVATIDGSVVGFASLKDNTHIDMLYVHPGFARQGVATLLCDAVEKLAVGRGATALTVDASDTARPFFDGRGYRGESRNTVSVGEEWLGNTTMKKTFAASDGSRA